MLKRSILVVLSIISIAFAGLVALSPVATFADSPQNEVCKGVGAATGSGCDSGISLTRVLHNVINIFSVIIGIVAVVMVMVGGFKYVTAAGDSGNITSAKQTLTYAVIGLVVAALSQALVRFVLDNIK